jgi:hypothetical protein
MIKVKIDKNTLTPYIIDDAESTPGASRTMTAFRVHVMPKITEILSTKDAEFVWLSDIYTTTFKADGMTFIAMGIQYEDNNEMVLNFTLCEEPKKYSQKLNWVEIGQYILAFLIGGALGALFHALA